MDEPEYDAMLATNTVQERSSGTTHVAYPANPNAFGTQAKTGQFYVEFYVPYSSLVLTNLELHWAKIKGPNTTEGRLAARKGLPIPQLPQAIGIVHVQTK